MARKWSNKNLPGALHFVTGNVHNRRPIFKYEPACRAFFEELQSLRKSVDCKVVAFVLMLDHFHLVVNPRDGAITEWVAALKSLTARRLIDVCPEDWFSKPDGTKQVWQESFRALALWSDWMIWQKINYIHANPIRAGLVRETVEYRWSSFHSFYERDCEDLLAVDADWSWPDDVQKLARAMGEWNAELEDKERGRAALPDLKL